MALLFARSEAAGDQLQSAFFLLDRRRMNLVPQKKGAILGSIHRAEENGKIVVTRA